MIRISALILLFFASSFIFKGEAQAPNLNYPLPIDKTIKKGRLANGLTYYIKNSEAVKHAASYYIIQNVGSILENEDQRGLAHFLEHMAFNGTKNFPGKGIFNTLQKHGAVFGKDINAYTSYDETVYNLSNIPTKNNLIDTCLTILHDWSNYLLLIDEEIDAERGVIKEEWRSRQNGQMRLYEAALPTIFNDSKYAYRYPIGLMSVVENFEYQTIRDFYHDWYRTDLQAIAVIGDFDVDEIEEKIIAKFSHIPAVENPRERIVTDIPSNEKLLYHLGTDPEVSIATISFGIRHNKSLKTETVADLKRNLQEAMAVSLVSSRIKEKEQDPDASFLSGRVVFRSRSRTSQDFITDVAPKPNRQKEAFKDVLIEVIRAVKFGFTPSEINRKIAEYRAYYQNSIAQKDQKSHRQIEKEIQKNFLENKTIIDIEKEYEIADKLFSTLKAKELHETVKSLYSKNDRYINISGVKGENNLTEEEVKQVLEQLENDNSISPYVEDLSGKTLISGLTITPGIISTKTFNEEIHATTYLLSNGIKVHYKFTDIEKNKVSTQAISLGGTSLLSPIDLPSARYTANLISMSGLGDYNKTDLDKILAGKTAHATINLTELYEQIYGSSSQKDIETMLQLTYMRFVKPRFDQEAFKVLINNLNHMLKRKSKSLKERIKDSLKLALYGKNNERERLFDQDYINRISFEKIKSIYNNRFSNAADFEFFIVGDIQEKTLIPLIEKYIASIPTSLERENYKTIENEWLSNKVNKTIYIPMENPKAAVRIGYKTSMPYTHKNDILAKFLGDMLQLRITETVRESEGGAYSPKATAYLAREPYSKASVFFSFDCNPDMVDNLVNIVQSELKKITKGIINEEDFIKTKTNFIKERDQYKNKKDFNMLLMKNYFRYGFNMDAPENFDSIVNNLSIKDIQKIAQKIFNHGQSYQIIFKPQP